MPSVCHDEKTCIDSFVSSAFAGIYGCNDARSFRTTAFARTHSKTTRTPCFRAGGACRRQAARACDGPRGTGPARSAHVDQCDPGLSRAEPRWSSSCAMVRMWDGTQVDRREGLTQGSTGGSTGGSTEGSLQSPATRPNATTSRSDSEFAFHLIPLVPSPPKRAGRRAPSDGGEPNSFWQRSKRANRFRGQRRDFGL